MFRATLLVLEPSIEDWLGIWDTSHATFVSTKTKKGIVVRDSEV